MKIKLAVIFLALFLLATPVISMEFSKPVTFAWDQASTDIPSLKEWGLYMMTISGGPKSNPIPVVYTGGNGPFTSSSTFTVTGIPGSTVRRYFVLDAVSKNGNRSGFSNEVFYDFIIPFADVTTPMTLRIPVTVTP